MQRKCLFSSPKDDLICMYEHRYIFFNINYLDNFGGCFWQESFYQSRINKGIISKNDLGLYVFASRPSSGAAIFKF